MLETKYDVWTRNDKEKFVVIPIEEYQAMRERLEDHDDFRAMEASKKRQAKSPRTSPRALKRELGFEGSKKSARR
jgi:PHD/YefM family antitoxin component YafN of YafNO toxin-antitoxin module